jgi:hypothetical protein
MVFAGARTCRLSSASDPGIASRLRPHRPRRYCRRKPSRSRSRSELMNILRDASYSPSSKKQFLVRRIELFCGIDNVTLGVEGRGRVGLSCLGAATSYEQLVLERARLPPRRGVDNSIELRCCTGAPFRIWPSAFSFRCNALVSRAAAMSEDAAGNISISCEGLETRFRESGDET